MITKVVKVDPYNPADELLRPCAEALRAGQLVAFPTETVYGLGANALMPEAVAKVFQAKGRPQDNPLIVHVSRIESVPPLVKAVSPLAARLMETFWPGPLTLLFPKSDLVPSEVTAGLPTVAIRMPDHPVAQRLIDLAQVPVAAPSANISGSPSPTTFEATLADLDGRVEYILDGGPAGIGVESTVLDISGPVPLILRPGGLSAEELSEVLGEVKVVNDIPQGPAPSPGMKYRHYAPRGDVYVASGDPAEQREAIILHSVKALISGKRVAVLASSENASSYTHLTQSFAGSFFVLELGDRSDLAPVAARLFSSLRYADSLGAQLVFAESFPEAGLGLAIQNRLTRSSGGRTLSRASETAFNVVMVCSGNTCRSPLAEGIFRREWDRATSEAGFTVALRVWSRGTAAVPGMPATQEAILAASRMGIDLRCHVSQPVSQEDVANADLVVAMTASHKAVLQRRFPTFAPKVRTLAEVSEGAVSGDVDDPIGLGQEAYDKTAATLEKGLRVLASRIMDMLKGPTR